MKRLSQKNLPFGELYILVLFRLQMVFVKACASFASLENSAVLPSSKPVVGLNFIDPPCYGEVHLRVEGGDANF